MRFQLHRRAGFTLIELAIAGVILVLLMMLAVPSMNGVMADRCLRRSLDSFNAIVRELLERERPQCRGRPGPADSLGSHGGGAGHAGISRPQKGNQSRHWLRRHSARAKNGADTTEGAGQH